MSRALSAMVAVILTLGATPTLAIGPIPTLEGGPGIVHDAGVVKRYYQDHPGQRSHFAGVWLKHGDPWKLMVMVTDDPPARPYAWEKAIANPDQLRFRSVEFSYQYLRRIQAKVSPDMGETPWAKRICGVGVGVSRNVVIMTSYTGYAPVGFWDHYQRMFPRRAVDFRKGCPIEGVD